MQLIKKVGEIRELLDWVEGVTWRSSELRRMNEEAVCSLDVLEDLRDEDTVLLDEHETTAFLWIREVKEEWENK